MLSAMITDPRASLVRTRRYRAHLWDLQDALAAQEGREPLPRCLPPDRIEAFYSRLTQRQDDGSDE